MRVREAPFVSGSEVAISPSLFTQSQVSKYRLISGMTEASPDGWDAGAFGARAGAVALGAGAADLRVGVFGPEGADPPPRAGAAWASRRRKPHAGMSRLRT